MSGNLVINSKQKLGFILRNYFVNQNKITEVKSKFNLPKSINNTVRQTLRNICTRKPNNGLQ